jgi:hypothetical protein
MNDRTTNAGAGSGIACEFATVEVSDMMRVFDRLHVVKRQIVRDAPYDLNVLNIKQMGHTALRQALANLLRESVLATYGPDHPQAK